MFCFVLLSFIHNMHIYIVYNADMPIPRHSMYRIASMTNFRWEPPGRRAKRRCMRPTPIGCSRIEICRSNSTSHLARCHEARWGAPQFVEFVGL